jgi:hypothetical protein
MNDIPPPPPSDPQPFGTAPPKAASGCQKPLLVGCGILALLLGAAAIVFVIKANDLLAFAMGQLRSQIVQRLPADLTEAERETFEQSFTTAIDRIRRKQVDVVTLNELQRKLSAAARDAASGKLTRPQVEELQRALDAFNGAIPDALELPTRVPAAHPAGS